jgi:hypothetical protein
MVDNNGEGQARSSFVHDVPGAVQGRREGLDRGLKDGSWTPSTWTRR